MFITIEALRNSDAMQDRVTTVENYLKRVYGNGKWNPKSPFPAAIVLISNTRDDYEWVQRNIDPTNTAYGGVNPENYQSRDEANYPVDPEFSTKADAQKFVDDLIEKAKTYFEPLLQYVEDAVSVADTSDKPLSKAKQTKAAINSKARSKKAAEAEFMGAASVEAPVKPALVSAPVKKLATDRDFPAHLASMRTRAQLDNALQAFLNNKMVKVLRPLTSEETKAVDIEVPKGKQAYVIVF